MPADDLALLGAPAPLLTGRTTTISPYSMLRPRTVARPRAIEKPRFSVLIDGTSRRCSACPRYHARASGAHLGRLLCVGGSGARPSDRSTPTVRHLSHPGGRG